MTVQVRIAEFLRDNRNVSFCDDCIALRLSLKRRQQSQAVTIELVWTVPATEKGIQEIVGSEKMHLISRE
jgi:hypothetical protein